MSKPVRITVAVPLAPELAERIAAGRPGVQLRYEPELVPPPRFPGDHAGEAGFVRGADAERRFRDLLTTSDVTYGFPGDTPAGLRDLLASAPELRWVHGTAAGAGQQARLAGVTAADLERVVLTTSAGVHGPSLAEFVLLGLLGGAKELPRLQRQQAAHAWPARRPTRQLAGRRLLVLGLGGIGAEVARLATALGMHVSAVRRRPGSGTVDGVDRVFGPDELAEAFDGTDDVVLALPGTEATDAVVSHDLLGRLADGATVVNVGRGSALDEEALVAALDRGDVGFAALDVTAVEPLPGDNPLWDHPQVLLSPHVAALTVHEDARIVALFCDNLDALLAGRALRNRVTADGWY